MKSNKKVSIALLSYLIIGSLFTSFIFTDISSNTTTNDKISFLDNLDASKTDSKDNNNPKTSKILTPIYINNNWSEAESAGLCTGDGTYPNPYTLKDLVIDGSQLKNGIRIENSTQDYFRIENCTLFNAGEGQYPDYIAAIRLNNTSNGIIRNNTCHSNLENGIAITYSENITIIDNNLHSNLDDGITISYSENITIIDNNLHSNERGYGIAIDKATSTSVLNNTIINNRYGGIILSGDSTNLTISDNIFINNNLDILNAYYLDILNNTFTNCYIDFFEFYGGSYMGIYDNLATLTIDIKNRINGLSIYYYKDINGLNYNNFTNMGIPGQVILVNCNNSIISKLNFSKGLSGISLFNSNNNKIVECNLTDNEEGIILSSVFNITITKSVLVNNSGITLRNSCNNNTFYSNTILYTDFGIKFYGSCNYNNISNNNINYCKYNGINFGWTNSDYNWIINNTLIENGEYGIQIRGKANVLMKNKMRNCGIQIYSTSRDYAGSQIIDSSNKINDKTIYYYANKQYLKPINFTKAGPSGQIILANCNNSLIKDLSISDTSVGLSLVYCENITIKGNTFSENKVFGLTLLHSINNSIYDNDLINNDEYGLNLESNSNFNNISNNRLNNNGYSGISLFDCHNNTIIDNIIRDNGEEGIYVQFKCENNTLSYNTIIYNEEGISLYNSHYNVITYNDIKNNEDEGIYLDRSNNNTILGNKVHFNSYGVYLEDSNNNTVTENEFLGNINNIREEESRDNKIYNNYFLTLPPTGGGDDNDDDDDDDDGSFEYDLISIMIFLIIIGAVGAIAGTSLYYYNHRNKKNKSIRKIRIQKSNKMVGSSLSSREGLKKLTNKSLLIKIFDTENNKDKIPSLDNIDLTTISNDFLNKIDTLIVDEVEKIEFLKEMLLFSPQERNEILDNILKRLKSYSEVK